MGFNLTSMSNYVKWSGLAQNQCRRIGTCKCHAKVFYNEDTERREFKDEDPDCAHIDITLFKGES